jgi:hypothetical protein
MVKLARSNQLSNTIRLFLVAYDEFLLVYFIYFLYSNSPTHRSNKEKID